MGGTFLKISVFLEWRYIVRVNGMTIRENDI
jgi:hypothetical protein